MNKARILIMVVAVMMATVSSCRSEKHTSSVESTHYQDSYATENVITADRQLWMQWFMNFMADSMCVKFTCDSVILQGTKVYAPDIEINATKPEVVNSGVVNENESDSTNQKTTGQSSGELNKRFSGSSNFVAVAAPPDFRWWPIVAIVAILLSGLIWWKKHKAR